MMPRHEASPAEKRHRLAELVRADPFAPRYHFMAPEYLCAPFDPNGAIFWGGRYHLFYIFQDESLPHHGHCWGHASSSDLLHWSYHPTALAPAPGDPDLGIFSGGAFVSKEGVPTIIYHGIEAGTCIATAEDDELIRWRKSPHNPVIPEPRPGGPGWGVYNVFDPDAWLDGDSYFAILGGKVKPHDLRDTAYLFRSPDLIHWEYLRPFYSPNPHWTGEEEDCACPDFFRLGARSVLLCISHPFGARYYLGRCDHGTFVPEEHHRMNWPGGPCFAPETLMDDRGRRILWTWALDQRRGMIGIREAPGVLTLPRVLSLQPEGALAIEPAAELRLLRRGERRLRDLRLAKGAETDLAEVRGNEMELELEAEVGSGGRLVLEVLCSADLSERTAIVYDAGSGSLAVDTTRASRETAVFRRHPIGLSREESRDVPVQTAPLALPPGDRLRLRVFVDRSILEVYANGVQCITQRVYPSRADSLGVRIGAPAGGALVGALGAWEMEPTNLD